MGNVLGVQISCDACFSLCLNCTLKEAAYVSQLEDNLVALQTQLQKLDEARIDLKTKVDDAEQTRMRRLNRVQGWFSMVEAAETKAGELIRRSPQEIEKLCLGGYCSKNCMSSHKFGKEVAKMLRDVETLMGESAFEVVAERAPPAAVDEMICEPTIVGMDSIFKKVWACLGEESVGIIGIYGIGGVGKTTLLTQINNKFIDMPKCFDVIIWVVVSKDLQLSNIQEKIGEKISLLKIGEKTGLSDESWKHKSCEDKASDIFKNLSKKKFLLLLDDIWERVDLVKVGVPPPTTNTSSKVVFTTRSTEVCGAMEAHMKFQVECLTDDEAWDLFQKKVGKDTLNSHTDIPDLAKMVAKECDGLPIALNTVGRAMACRKTPEEWRYTHQLLRRSSAKFLGMGKEVYPVLKFSYDSLPDDKIRSCLLYCSLFPEDYAIEKDELIDCWISEGFLDETDGSEIKNRGYHIIGVLVHACLLKEVGDYRVEMHDVIRDMALWIACEIEKEKENYLVRAGAGLTEAPEIEQWEGVSRVSLMGNKIENLSEIPSCPALLTLFLQRNNLQLINSDFFQFMHSLRVLSLSWNRSLTRLPSGISKLVSLQYLDFSTTNIKKVPKELKSLVNLRCLNLEYTSLHRIPRQLISSFTKLRVLKMFRCGRPACDQAEEDNILSDGGELLVLELLGLKHLCKLTMTLFSFHALQRFLGCNKFESCTEALQLAYFDDLKSLDLLCLADLEHLELLGIEACKLLEELKIGNIGEIQKARQPHAFRSLGKVWIFECHKLRDLTSLVFVPNLKILRILNCRGMEDIICVGKLCEGQEMTANIEPFTKLERLILCDLPNLKSIYCKALPFQNLKEIEIIFCPELKKLPLDSNSGKQRQIRITGEEDWWKKLQWEDEATQNVFLPFFTAWESR